MKRLQQKIVSVVESDEDVPKARMRGLHRVNKLPQSGILPAERDYGKGAECVEGGSIALRLGTVRHSRDRSMFELGFGPKETDYLSDLELSETFSLPKRPSKDTNNLHKKVMQNSSELAEPRRLPTACFGLVKKQETESYATQVVDSQPSFGDRVALRTREAKRNSNPFTEKR